MPLSHTKDTGCYITELSYKVMKPVSLNKYVIPDTIKFASTTQEVLKPKT